jgi:acetyl-CoA C-acetyltransferase
MTIKGKAYIAGAYEHPTRHAPDKTVAQLHAEVALGALKDAGLARDDVDGYFCAGDAPAPGAATMAEYMNLKLRHLDSTELGGTSYVALAAHAAEAIALGKCNVALVTLAGRPRSDGQATGTAPRQRDASQPEAPWEGPYGLTTANSYAMCAMRHMHQYGTTSEQLAWIKVAASHHAQHNPNAMLPDVVTVEDVVNSPVIASPLHRLDCCVISDGGGALVIVKPEIARSLKRPPVKIIGAGETVKHLSGGFFDLTTSGAARTGPAAFAEAGIKPADIKYASIYDSFTITVLIQIEDLGILRKGRRRQVRLRRQSDFRRRQAAVQHRRRRAVQQPSRQSRRHDQGDRGGAAIARRSASGGAGEELRSRVGAGHRLQLGSRHGSATLIMERE